MKAVNVLITGARAPIAADLARALARSGHRVWVADSTAHPVGAASPHVQGYLRLPAPAAGLGMFARALGGAIRGAGIDTVIPTSEEIFWLAACRHRLPAGVELRAAPFETLAALHHKGRFARLAAELGYGVPGTMELESPAEVASVREPERYVFKPAYSRFASRTLLSPDARRLARVRPTREFPWIAQTRLHGRELCAYNLAERGRLLVHVAYEPLVRFGTGAGVYFAPVADGRLRRMSERFVARTGFSGQIAFDCIVTDHGVAAIECNPRGTSGVHLAAQEPDRLAAAVLGREPPGSAPGFRPEARWLLLPMALRNPGLFLSPRGRALRAAGRDVLSAAGIPPGAQIAAMIELGWRALRTGTGLAEAATEGIEWNGQPMEPGDE